jgi:hypothetical protein
MEKQQMNTKHPLIGPSLLSFTLALCGLTTSVEAQVPSPNVYDSGNRWLITAFDDASPVHTEWATQGICFLPYATAGTQIRGIWYSDTFPDWNGRYTQEGDHVEMHGDYAQNVGHDGISFELVTDSTADEGSGQWTEWREDASYGRTIGFLNTKLRRVGRCRFTTIDSLVASGDVNKATIRAELQAISQEIPERQLVNGDTAQNPLDQGQVQLDTIVQPLNDILIKEVESLHTK